MLSLKKVIAIDGPAGAGKSSVAKRIAQELSYSYLDTGAMYRALTLKAMREDLNLEDEDVLVALAKDTQLEIQHADNGVKVILDGEDVSQEIRTVDVTNNTFYIARAPKVREIMVQWQRENSAKNDVVVEGRDVGTVVFPDAKFKFYLDADFNERTQRRFNELIAKGKEVEIEKLKKELNERDQKDISREAGPLKKADDAVFIDSTGLSVEDVVQIILKHINNSG